MACTLQSLRIGRTFDSDYPRNQKALTDDTNLSTIAVTGQVDELKVTPEATCTRKSVMLAYKLYKYRDKLMNLIDGSRGQYRVCIIHSFFHYHICQFLLVYKFRYHLFFFFFQINCFWFLDSKFTQSISKKSLPNECKNSSMISFKPLYICVCFYDWHFYFNIFHS